MKKLFFCAGALVAAVLSCKSGAVVNGDVKKLSSVDAGKNEGANGEPGPTIATERNSESVDIPTAITGALLTCATTESNDKVEVKVGCSLYDASKVKIVIASTSKKQEFSFSGSVPSGVVVNMLPADSVQDVYFAFTGADFNKLESTTAGLVYRLKLVDVISGQSETVGSIVKSAIAIPPPPRWVIEPRADLNANKICDVEETCGFLENGLLWYRDGGRPEGHVRSRDFCEAWTMLSYDDWRLPTAAELKMAFEKDIAKLQDLEQLHLNNSPYWSQTPKIAGGVEPDPFLAVNPVTGAITEQAAATTLRSICVRTIK